MSSSSEVRHKGKEPQKEPQDKAQEAENDFLNGPHWTKANKMTSDGATLFNILIFKSSKNGKFKPQMSKSEALEIFRSEEDKDDTRGYESKNLPEMGEMYRGLKERFQKETGEVQKEKTTKKAPVPPATATPQERKNPEEDNKLLETVIKENEELKAKIAQHDEDEKKLREMAERLQPAKVSENRPEIPAEVINKEPEKKPVDELAPAPLENLTVDEKQRQIADTFPNTKALQTGCYETIRNTDFSKVHFNASELRPENNYTRGLTNKINVIQKVNVGNLNKYILR